MQLLAKPATVIWLGVFFAVLAWSGWAPKDRMTWVLEVTPAVIGLVILAFTQRKHPLTALAAVLVLIHCVILMVGGKYTYAEVPLFDWIREVMGHSRNNYDKVGHFAQGFVPAVLCREVFMRTGPLRPGWWLSFHVVSFCLAFSALYELVEWWVALASGASAEAFLGTQGYIWDTQSDMFYCLIGAIVAVSLMSRWHDRQLARLRPELYRKTD